MKTGPKKAEPETDLKEKFEKFVQEHLPQRYGPCLNIEGKTKDMAISLLDKPHRGLVITIFNPACLRDAMKLERAFILEFELPAKIVNKSSHTKRDT